MKKTILVSAGGTGGHIFPALAVVIALQEEYEIIWVGSKYGIENKIAKEHGIPMEKINISALRNKGLMRILFMPFMLLWAFLQSLKVILKYRPDIIIGFGGYATFPICFMGKMLACKVVIHEQNSVAGLTNRILARLVDFVLVAYNGVFASQKTILVGNPVRSEILNVAPVAMRFALEHRHLRILVLGGSLGARVLNEKMPDVIAKTDNVALVIHQVGRGDEVQVAREYQNLGVNAKVYKFIDNMAEVYSEVDLVICRSGASTVSELMGAGLGAIFIPYPYAVDDHQRYNAMPMVENGAAKIVLEHDFTIDVLAAMINQETWESCKVMAIKAEAMGIRDSTARICKIIQSLISKG